MSEYGFTLDCNFKKSGLFRVRNLGGVKAHFGLGLSVGDELGFKESLSIVESDRRRAINYRNGPPELVGVLPSSRQKEATVQHALPEKRITSRSSGPGSYNLQLLQQAAKVAKSQPQPPQGQLMTEARPLPMGVPIFKPIPQKAGGNNEPQPTPVGAQRRIAVDTTQPRVSVNNKLVDGNVKPHSNRTFHADNQMVAQPKQSLPQAVPVFQAMPDSISRIANVGKTELVSPPAAEQRTLGKHPNYLQFEEPKFDLRDVTVEELAAAANVTVDTIKHAIYVREQQLKAEHRAMLASKLREEFIRTSTVKTTTTTTTTTPKPNQLAEHKVSKVMNAPKEYYPVGYDKNFDDNFKSKVDLPPTSFSCARQKHFPGLYADTDLGCMVFHVCALTDDGMVRKSFLCPENTLFDQTILKCNWWFYVDCSASKSVYDSNIPISKSYQLMKSLTYFSKYNNQKSDQDGDKDENAVDIDSLRESMEGVSRRLEQAKNAQAQLQELKAGEEGQQQQVSN
ncbi:GH14202 [Drosophila grimshawi]|uniref:GH14202 n=2 Tax=Drosophila grimshawi TaxID=7222 RepID=B4JXZ8_DROGR|nr:GH14202 [Drosophila grimshawi]